MSYICKFCKYGLNVNNKKKTVLAKQTILKFTWKPRQERIARKTLKRGVIREISLMSLASLQRQHVKRGSFGT